MKTKINPSKQREPFWRESLLVYLCQRIALVFAMVGLNFNSSMAQSNPYPILIPSNPSQDYYSVRQSIVNHFNYLDSAGVSYEDDEYLKYARWMEFWDDRVYNNPDNNVSGDMNHYREAFQQELQNASMSCYSSNSWESINQLSTMCEQGRIDAIAFDNNSGYIFVGNNRSGIWRLNTQNLPSQWEVISDNINKPLVGVNNLYLYYGNPQNPLTTPILFAGTGTVNDWTEIISYGIFKSEDLGQTWTNCLEFDGIRENVMKIDGYYDPTTNQHVIFAASDKHVFRSLDSGNNWELIFNDPSINAEWRGNEISSLVCKFETIGGLTVPYVYFAVSCNPDNCDENSIIYKFINSSDIMVGTGITNNIFTNNYFGISLNTGFANIGLDFSTLSPNVSNNSFLRTVYIAKSEAQGGEDYLYVFLGFNNSQAVNDPVSKYIIKSVNGGNSWNASSPLAISGL
jgi:hypothetical protein